jgi:glucose-1-phosphate cytidylyltransferase
MPAKSVDRESVPVVILCGGKGTRFSEETQFSPKPLLSIGSLPIVWHVMNVYAAHGFNRFILCLGYKAEMIKKYFLDYEALTRDFTMRLGNGGPKYHGRAKEADWQITMADTGQSTQTGGRIKRIEKYIGSAPNFMVTYADGVADVDVGKLFDFHMGHGKIGTVSGVKPASQFGELKVEGTRVTSFAEKPQVTSLINGGFFVFRREIFNYLRPEADCVLEREPMERLARDGELQVHRHDGFWQCMDTQKDWIYLNELWDSGNAYWLRRDE